MMRIRLVWKKSQKTLDKSKRLHQNKTRSTESVGKGLGKVQVRQVWGYLAGVWNVLAGAAYNQVLNCGSPQTQGGGVFTSRSCSMQTECHMCMINMLTIPTQHVSNTPWCHMCMINMLTIPTQHVSNTPWCHMCMINMLTIPTQHVNNTPWCHMCMINMLTIPTQHVSNTPWSMFKDNNFIFEGKGHEVI